MRRPIFHPVRSVTATDASSRLAPARDHPAHPEIADDLNDAPVDVFEQPLFKADVRLGSGEKVLHDVAEFRAETRELHHSGGDGSAQEAAVEDAVAEAGGEFEIGHKVAPQQSAISGSGEGDSVAEQRAGGEIRGTNGVIDALARNG